MPTTSNSPVAAKKARVTKRVPPKKARAAKDVPAKKARASKTVPAKKARATKRVPAKKALGATSPPSAATPIESDPTLVVPDPPTEDEYPGWLNDRLNSPLTPEVQNRYDSVSRQLRDSVQTSAFWTALTRALVDTDASHQLRTTYRLLAPRDDDSPRLDTKPFDSLVLKTYRKNVLDNTDWPDPPGGTWVTPSNWFSAIADIVRTTVVVKYLDGVQIVTDLVCEVASSFGLPVEPSFEAREEGYYAAHISVRLPLLIPGPTWQLESIDAALEVQVATQVQDVIRALTHKFYEERRRRKRDPTLKWQWDYRAPEWIPNYLGHILHYVEGMIMEIRDKQEITT